MPYYYNKTVWILDTRITTFIFIDEVAEKLFTYLRDRNILHTAMFLKSVKSAQVLAPKSRCDLSPTITFRPLSNILKAKHPNHQACERQCHPALSHSLSHTTLVFITLWLESRRLLHTPKPILARRREGKKLAFLLPSGRWACPRGSTSEKGASMKDE